MGALLIVAGIVLGVYVLAGGVMLVIRPRAGAAFARMLAHVNIDIVHHFGAAVGIVALLFLGGAVIVYVTGRLAIARRDPRA